jgi:hypothetical protein
VVFPGMKRVRYLGENAAAGPLKLTGGQLGRVPGAIPPGPGGGDPLPAERATPGRL